VVSRRCDASGDDEHVRVAREDASKKTFLISNVVAIHISIRRYIRERVLSVSS